MIEELGCHSKQGEVVVPTVHEELDRCCIDLERERFQKADECVNQFFVVEVEFKLNQSVEEWMA